MIHGVAKLPSRGLRLVRGTGSCVSCGATGIADVRSVCARAGVILVGLPPHDAAHDRSLIVLRHALIDGVLRRLRCLVWRWSIPGSAVLSRTSFGFQLLCGNGDR